MTFTPEVWSGVLRRLRLELPPFICEAWIESIQPESSAGRLRLLCPTSFHRDRVRDHYMRQITSSLKDEMRCSIPVDVGVAGPAPVDGRSATDEGEAEQARVEQHAESRPRTVAPPDAPDAPEKGVARRGAPSSALRTSRASEAARAASGAIEAGSSLAPRHAQHTFKSFIVGGCNALAREASLAILRDDGPALSQLYLCGAPGLGKTHLSRAVWAEARARGRRSVYTSAEGFTNEFLSSLRNRKTAGFKQKFRHRCDVLVVEDVEFFQGKETTQLEFFHTVKHVLDVGGRVVLTGSRLPQAFSALDAPVRSQLSEGFVAELGPPDAQVRRNILRAKAAAGGVRLPEDCLDLLVDSVRGSVRELESVLIQLVTTASLLKQPIDAALAREALDKKGAQARTTTPLDPSAVIGAVASFFQTTPDSMASRSRKHGVLVPRQLAMYLCHRYTDASLAEIGHAFGRDHPAVRNAITKIERATLERAPLRYQVEALIQKLDEIAAAPR